MNWTLTGLVIFGLAIIAGVWALVKRIKEGARAEISAEVAEEATDVLRDMNEAAVNGPKTKADVVSRLRKRGL